MVYAKKTLTMHLLAAGLAESSFVAAETSHSEKCTNKMKIKNFLIN